MLTKPLGFVTDKEMAKIVKLDPAMPMLIRCGMRCGMRRYVVPAALVESTLAVVRASGDYVRDVSFSAEEMDAARAARAQ